MKLKEYIQNLNSFVRDNPSALEYEVVYSTDDEGNEFNRVSYPPTLGRYEDDEFHTEDWYEEDDYHYDGDNAVCIN